MPSKKQAVLLIHGIGEQRPMETLHSFIDTVWTTDTKLHRPHKKGAASWSKPYNLSKNYELRRITTPKNIAGIRTDFYEFYWQHLMQGTLISHVLVWAKTLLIRNPKSVPMHLKWVFYLMLLLVICGVIFFYFSSAISVDDEKNSLLPNWLAFGISFVVVPLFLWIIKNIVGDAARYLHQAPPNIQRRHEIRSAGVEVITALHEQGYQRIIVVGHSLGSVIGYDILNYAWNNFNAEKPTGDNIQFTALAELESIAASLADNPATIKVDDVQNSQRRYFNELKANKLNWRVTDFITLGCPLTHAEILLARNAEDLNQKIESREIPSCQPVLEESQVKKETVRLFSYPANRADRTPHHAAVFAPTCWTNLYFPSKFIFWGDLVGGPLRRLFGSGIKDIPVSTSKWKGFFSHTFYWRSDGKVDSHIRSLRDTLDLAGKRNE